MKNNNTAHRMTVIKTNAHGELLEWVISVTQFSRQARFTEEGVWTDTFRWLHDENKRFLCLR